MSDEFHGDDAEFHARRLISRRNAFGLAAKAGMGMAALAAGGAGLVADADLAMVQAAEKLKET